MEVGTGSGVCNNSPAEFGCAENSWRSSERLILDQCRKCEAALCRLAWRLCRSPGVSRDGTVSSADLGGSSKYKSVKLLGRSGEGFCNKGNPLQVTRS